MSTVNKITKNKIPKQRQQSFRGKKRQNGESIGTYPGGMISVGGQSFSTLTYNKGVAYGKSGSMGNEMYVERTEPIGPVTSGPTSGAFTPLQYLFHPQNPGTFWLNNMSNAFTSYEVLRAEFTFVPSVPTTTAGSFSMAFNEDLRDDTPSTMGQLLAFEQSLLAPVYAGAEGGRFLQRFGNPGGNVVSFELPHHVIKDASGVPKQFKITKHNNLLNAIAAATDGSIYATANYCPGRLLVGTSGIVATNSTVGELFIRYRIRLCGAIPLTLQQ